MTLSRRQTLLVCVTTPTLRVICESIVDRLLDTTDMLCDFQLGA